MEHEKLLQLERVTNTRTACQQYATRYGINPLAVYCSHTGRELSRLNDDAIILMIDSLGDEPEDLVTHCLLAARPSPSWSHQTVANIKDLLLADPVGAATKFIMTAFESTMDLRKQRNIHKASGRFEHAWKHNSDKAKWQHARISIFTALADEPLALLRRVTATLLRADSEIGLHNIDSPAKVGFPDRTDWEKLIAFYESKIHDHGKRRIHRKRTGNTMSAMVFHSYARATETPSEARLAKERRGRKASDVANIFREMLGGVTVDQAQGFVLDPESLGATFKANAKPAPTPNSTGVQPRILGAFKLSTVA